MGRTAPRSSALGPDRPVPRGDLATAMASPALLGLTDLRTTDAGVVGGKAAALARAAREGLPTLPGVVIPVGAELDGLTATSPLVAAIREQLGRGPLIARSSSPWEDAAEHSMAGRFVSLRSLADDVALARAIRVVAGSGRAVALDDGLEVVPPVAVLVQPMAEGAGGVCFGVEPVTGRNDRLSAVVSAAGPEAVASGRVDGVRHVLDPRGRLVRREGDGVGGGLSRRQCRALAALVQRVGRLFGAPQDVEFLFERDGTLRLLQSRPVTTAVTGAPTGPVYGSGPVAETFPDPLRPLELGLWVEPLRDGFRAALRLAALAGPKELERRPLVVDVDGRVAMDLELAGAERQGRRWSWRHLRGWARRARATWRVGRLRGALPVLSRDLVQHADGLLVDVGALRPLSDRQLVGLLERSRSLLRSLHAHEILMGLLITGDGAGLTGGSLAVRSLVAGRREGLADDEIVGRTPIVLALTPPRVEGAPLPRHLDVDPPPLPLDADGDEAALLREALRLRIRWVQELSARAARVLGQRLAERGRIDDASSVVLLDYGAVAALVAGAAAAPPRREDGGRRVDGPLPSRFRFDAEGRVVPVETDSGDGTGAGGGTGRGRVVHDPHDAAAGSVLVVRHLSPDLAWVLPSLAGLVAETGSPLAHLAILARETGVPTVVAASAALSRFGVGALVLVDGASGAVVVLDEDGEGS